MKRSAAEEHANTDRIIAVSCAPGVGALISSGVPRAGDAGGTAKGEGTIENSGHLSCGKWRQQAASLAPLSGDKMQVLYNNSTVCQSRIEGDDASHGDPRTAAHPASGG